MHADIVDLREFYLSPLGQTVQRLLLARIRRIWPNLQGERTMTLGYGTPFMQPFLQEASSLIAMMPAAQGIAYWPSERPNLACLVETNNLPLPDNSLDRVVLVHALEGTSAPNDLLREVWRVLKSGGRMLMIVPNRRGLWAHSDRTPFGTGQPYSSFQIKDTLRDHGFLADRVWHALYMPPSTSRITLSLADFLEKYGERLFPGFGGLLIMEAGKQLYGPSLVKPRNLSHRLVLPLPMGDPLPAS